LPNQKTGAELLQEFNRHAPQALPLDDASGQDANSANQRWHRAPIMKRPTLLGAKQGGDEIELPQQSHY